MTFIIKFFNNLKQFPYLVITVLPYSFGNTLEDIRLGQMVAKKKNKKLIFITPTIFPKFLKYKINSKFLIKNLTVTKISIVYILVKFVFTFILNLDFLFSRIYFLYYKKKIKNITDYDFPYIGLENLYTNKEVSFESIEKYDNFKLSFLIPKKFYTKSQNILKKINYNNNSKIVCIHVRDSSFHNDKNRRSYRNPTIENYYDSINYLLDKGYSVFRLGLVAEKKIQIFNKNFFDLPFLITPDEIEFLQFYLVENCQFFIAHESGPQYLPWFQNKPTLYTNVFKFFYLTSPNINCRYTFRKIFDKKKNKLLNLREYLRLPYAYHDVNKYNDNFLFIENTKEELLNSLKEFEEHYINKNWKLSNLQIEFNDFIKKRLKEMFINKEKDQKNNLSNQNYKILIVKNIISNLGSATQDMIKKNFY
jgi:putative glycosyltransferase (TIGR04372 family)